jgi:hypothetical protein
MYKTNLYIYIYDRFHYWNAFQKSTLGTSNFIMLYSITQPFVHDYRIALLQDSGFKSKCGMH